MRPTPASSLASLISAVVLVVLTGCAPAASPAFTVHYHRASSDYVGWTATASAGAVETGAVASSGADGWGATFPLTVATGAQALTFTVQGTGVAEPKAFTVDVSGSVREVWLVAGSETPITTRPPAIPGANQVAVYYKRSDGDYAGWGLHLWGDQVLGTEWGRALQTRGVSDVLGAGFLVDLPKGGAVGNCRPGLVCLIVHKGELKDPGDDMSFDVAAVGNVAFLVTGSTTVTSFPRNPSAFAGAAAHLLRRNVLAWQVDAGPGGSYELRYSPTADVQSGGGTVTGGVVLPLQASGPLEPSLVAQVPHLRTFTEFTLDAGDLSAVKQALKGQLVAVARAADGTLVGATGVQTGFALDDLYAYEGPLGPSFDGGMPTLALWAPTANAVTLKVFDQAKAEVASLVLTADDHGVWTATGPTSWNGNYYQYVINVYHPGSNRVETFTVTDPYSVNLSTNGTYSQIVNLADPALAPPGWSTFTKPVLAAPEDIVIYESHVRDFSAFDPSVPADRVGKYLAFAPSTDGGALTAGQQHLQALAQAGLTHIHVLPAFDISSVDEDPAHRVDLDRPFSELCAKNSAVPAATCTQFAGKTVLQAYRSVDGGSDQQAALAGYLAKLDSFNWGYDPFHYGALEGSYASTAEGTAKIVEFRQLVMGLSSLGLRTVMDVVYNHTTASGATSAYSVLDKVVPGYYHRLKPDTGAVETSSCCANTATERRMMERLMIDTLVRFARDYKVDGFRFDLMGLHFKSNLLNVKQALQALTVANDGVDGSQLYLYGEGWSMGELLGNSHGLAATQVVMAGTGIGTFNDRMRDAVRGGSPFDSLADLRKNQGFASGLYLDPNELAGPSPASLSTLLDATDWLRVGMAGNLAAFRLQNRNGTAVAGNSLAYKGDSAGYTEDPQESINYVSAHDNQTLWDIMAYRLPTGTAPAARVRAHDVALDTVLLGQGIPFFHLGDDLLRSKSLDGNSYDSGDWFNQVDWSGQVNGWRNGLPAGGPWAVIEPLFSDATARVSAADIAVARAHFQTMLKVRKSSPLFRLRTRDEVMTRVDFTNTGPSQKPGVVAMTITDGTCAGPDVDPARDALVVILNADKVPNSIDVTGAEVGPAFTLHALLQSGSDPVVKTASVSGKTFTVPARTTAVFERLQGGTRGAGLPCNTR